ncbi:MAG: aminotransferase class IV [Spirochaetes bacterium]|nr:aminotransferase class IV [Spirochaetota bacterium]MBN2770218.1 aminotransferase class IV [Spirochaetota bacterium]
MQCLLSEAIRLDNGILYNMDYHNRRFNSARRELFKACNPIDLSEHINVDQKTNGMYKVRVVYDVEVISVNFEPYHIKPVNSLRVVECPDISYRYKYCDRSIINGLMQMRKDCDDIIITVNGIISDASSSNLVFVEKETGAYVTPKTCMLRGTAISRLIEEGAVKEELLSITDISRFTEVHLVNAMVDMCQKIVSVKNIKGIAGLYFSDVSR